MSARSIVRRPVPEAPGLPSSLHPVLRRVYAARGLGTAEDLDLRLAALLPVSSLDGVDAAVELLLEHLERGSSVVIVGDYDADGATSTALMVRQLRRLGFLRVDFCVPDRLRHGYGLTAGLVAEMNLAPPALLVTVDNGVAAFAGIEAARARGFDVLVTDHHLPAQELPACNAMVNPNLRGAAFGSRALAGVGVAFYVMAALTRRLESLRGERLPAVAELLDLVALGTVADVVPLDRNNRILVQEGLRRARARRGIEGIRALAHVAGRAVTQLGARDLGFGVAPRLNAAGRIDDMSIGIRCLLADDPAQALALAGQLDRINVERREMEEKMRGEAVELVRRLRIEEGSLPAGLALFDPAWHPGIVGLVASRIKERLHRPVVAFAPAGDGELRGSARSVAGVHVRDVLEAIDVREPGLMLRYGGHAMAAGLSLDERRLARFKAAFAEEVGRWLSPSQMRGVIDSDGELAPVEIALDTARALAEGGPWGQGFPEPLFDGEFEVVESRVVAQRHLKLWARASREAKPIEAIAFGHFDAPQAPTPRAGERVRLAYRLDVTEFGGTPRPELKLDLVEPLPPR
ncbi:MAG: single-stranded-DNA-specific exonuclease RecJ [Steroidobacteraceae bacterium]|jgi:single-stranded-DNA-specific exonuclease|nr:single-stranded-DNA-specific exonuclease RecJ [Steroidobacteraceae bacterium]